MSFRLLLGAAKAPIYPAGDKLNAQWMTSAERGRGAVLLVGGAPLGAAIGGIAISLLIALTGGWRLAFVIASVATVLIGLVAARYIRNALREHRERTPPKPTTSRARTRTKIPTHPSRAHGSQAIGRGTDDADGNRRSPLPW
jgi:MFS family permease